tara:strand:- start:62 stop:208 length:147 start_codon:yes stop_codon:yes gene_type:complete
MDYWMRIKWNEMVLDYNIMISKKKNKKSVEDMLDRYEIDVNIFYSDLY